MPVLSGIYYRNQAPANKYLVARLFDVDVETLIAPSSPNMLFAAQQNTTNTTSCQQAGVYVIGDLSLYNTSELERLVCGARGTNVLALVIELYKKFGEKCVEYLVGDFMFAIWDERQQKLFCARDQIGHRPFYYYLDDEVFVFSNKIHPLSHAAFASDIDDEWVAQILSKDFSADDRSKTIYKNIRRLLPAFTLSINAREYNYKQYWSVDKGTQQQVSTIADAVEGIKWHFEDAVKCRITDNSRNGFELSGGLDSSAITAVANKYLANPCANLWTFSNALPAEYKTFFSDFGDETERINMMYRHLGIKNGHFNDNDPPNPLKNIEKHISQVGYPAMISIGLAHQPIYGRALNDNIHTLFSGFGGDEMVTSNLYTTYLKYLMQSMKLSKAVAEVNRQGHSFSKSILFVLRKTLKRKFGIEGLQTAETLNASMASLFLKDSLLQNNNEKQKQSLWPDIKGKHKQKIQSFGVVERLETSYLAADVYGIQYKYPFFHTPLLEYFYAIPDEMKITHIHGRGLFRMAINSFLPPEIVEVRKPRDTFVSPALKVEKHKYFDELKQWLLAQPVNNPVFDIIDRVKLQQLDKDGALDMRVYNNMGRAAMLIMFFNQQQNRQLYEV